MSIWDEEELKKAATRLYTEAGIPLPEKQPEPKKILTPWDILIGAPTIRNGPWEVASLVSEQWAGVKQNSITTDYILTGNPVSRPILAAVFMNSSAFREYALNPTERSQFLDLMAMMDRNFKEKTKKNAKVYDIWANAMLMKGT